MANQPELNLQAAHEYFSKECFSRAWDYIEKPVRNQDEADRMLQLSLAALWHWTQREDATPTNFSIGCWQVSRVFSLLGQGENARHYGELCLQAALKPGVDVFFQGYAYEALARAEMAAENPAKMEQNLTLARQIAAGLPESEEVSQLLQDLSTIH